jgi:hypothetical protein
MIRYLMLIAMGIAGENGPQEPSSPPPPQQLKTARLVLKGMKDNRDRLRSGVFRAHGTRQQADESGKLQLNHPVAYYCAFDFAKDAFRFDGDDFEMIGSEGPPPSPPKPTRVKTIYADTPKENLFWYGRTPYRLHSRRSGAAPDLVTTIFDVRCLGISYMADMQERFTPFTKLCDNLGLNGTEGITRVRAEADGVVRVDWARGYQSLMKDSVWFDEKRGYSPIRLEFRYGDYNSPIQEKCETTFARVSDVWVPRTFVIERTPRGRMVKRLELAFEWESVNKPVSRSLFTADGLGLPRGTEILSLELGRPVILGYVGGSDAPAPRTGVSTWVRGVLLGASLVAILTIAFLLLRRYRAAHAW